MKFKSQLRYRLSSLKAIQPIRIDFIRFLWGTCTNTLVWKVEQFHRDRPQATTCLVEMLCCPNWQFSGGQSKPHTSPALWFFDLLHLLLLPSKCSHKSGPEDFGGVRIFHQQWTLFMWIWLKPTLRLFVCQIGRGWKREVRNVVLLFLFHSKKKYNLAERVTNSVIVNQYLTGFIRKPNKERVCVPATSCHSIEQGVFDEADLQTHTSLWMSALSSNELTKLTRKGLGRG